MSLIRVASVTFGAWLVLFSSSLAGQSAEAAERLIEMTALADEVAFEIGQNRQQIIDQCRASQWCASFGVEVLAAVEGADQKLQLGRIAVPRVAELFEHLDLETLRVIVEFYQSPLGRRVVELERRVRTRAGLDEVAAKGEETFLRQTEERRVALQAIDAIADVSAMQRSLDRYAGRVVDWVTGQAKEQERKPVEAAALEMDRSHHAVFKALSFTYDPLSLEELEAYVDFLDSKGGSNWINARQEVRRNSVRAAVEPILAKLVEEIGN